MFQSHMKYLEFEKALVISLESQIILCLPRIEIDCVCSFMALSNNFISFSYEYTQNYGPFRAQRSANLQIDAKLLPEKKGER